MYRIISQLCEVFDCTNQQIEEYGLLDQFQGWLKKHPEISVSHDIETGETVNYEISVKFKKGLFLLIPKTCNSSTGTVLTLWRMAQTYPPCHIGCPQIGGIGSASLSISFHRVSVRAPTV